MNLAHSLLCSFKQRIIDMKKRKFIISQRPSNSSSSAVIVSCCRMSRCFHTHRSFFFFFFFLLTEIDIGPIFPKDSTTQKIFAFDSIPLRWSAGPWYIHHAVKQNDITTIPYSTYQQLNNPLHEAKGKERKKIYTRINFPFFCVFFVRIATLYIFFLLMNGLGGTFI